ncbi:hypothetical protein NUM3379_07960 [Kineococcus sp. NUM-3379]
MGRVLAAVAVAAASLLALPSAHAAPGAVAPATSCPPGGYNPEPWGSLLIVQSTHSVSDLDTNRDGWVCWGPAYYGDNLRPLPVTPRPVEKVYDGDVMGPPLGGGLCCDGARAIDRRADTFHAAGYTEATDSRFDSSRMFSYDRNDIFYVDGTLTSYAEAERALSEGDVFSVIYAPRKRQVSVWSFYSHEV